MDTMMSRLATSEGSINYNIPTPSRYVNPQTISSRLETLGWFLDKNVKSVEGEYSSLHLTVMSIDVFYVVGVRWIRYLLEFLR